MNLSESFLTALDSLLANKLRSVLTMLGVIIGVAAVIALMSIGNGVNASITGEIQSIGTNLISISTDFDNSGGYAALSLSDVAALSDPFNAPAVSAVSAVVQGSQEVVYGGNTSRVSVSGVTPNYFTVNNVENLMGGDVFTQQDYDTQGRVVVLGYTVAEDLFEEEYAVGNSVRIGGVSYEVIGVMEKSGSNFSQTDTAVFLPLTTAQSRLFTERTRTGEKAVSGIIAQAASEDQTDAAIDQITETLRDQHGITYANEDDFSIFSQSDLLDTFDVITGTLTAFLGAIAGISLVVGGIGIMNIMLVSVTERTREIGIRKAVGALKRDILVQFLMESILLSVVGGLLGVTLGWLMATVAGQLIDLETVVDGGTVLLATGFAASVGLVFGIYPAWRAASLRPIEALRYE
ncbi:MAG: ABC transporter permease [Chloroflexi bacterium]|nr:ABC transporter permease [Chloroflexota bacterium]MBK6711825.1 ABC transporter permease [Chloroflexota bacterium]MBK7180197.1 ABC transporter permease [Chloroflexota bacterium]MBK8931647.1 ABC transporter permease [Chloroflexota bacterium]MBP7591815.1 ABC transporter permease [Chloroflexota bacterium]